jgi:hypothetical protein
MAKDARGHGSAAHQSGVEAARDVPRTGLMSHFDAATAAKYGKIAAKVYIAQAAAGAAVGFSIPWLHLMGIL